MDLKYMLTTYEVQDLFKIGKQARETDTNEDVIKTMLTHLVQKKPFLWPRQVRWWVGTIIINNLEMPDWLLEAKAELENIDEYDNG